MAKNNLKDNYGQYEEQVLNNSEGMFKSFPTWHGRIRRLEYGIDFIVYFVLTFIIREAERGTYIDEPKWWFLWFLGATLWMLFIFQSIKRAHDANESGWGIIIPFYVFYLLFVKGSNGINQYGSDPKRSYNAQIDELMQNEEEQDDTTNVSNDPKAEEKVIEVLDEENTTQIKDDIDLFEYQGSGVYQAYASSQREEIGKQSSESQKNEENKSNNSDKKTILAILGIIIILVIAILFAANKSTPKFNPQTSEKSIEESIEDVTSEDSQEVSEKDIELEQFNQQMIEEAALENSKAGTYVSEGVKLASVTYDVEDRAMVFEYQTTNLIADALSQSSPKEHKDEMINEMKSEKQLSVVKIAMEEYDFKYKYIFKKKNGNTVRSITISWSDFQ